MTKQLSQLGKEKALLQEKVNTLELRLSDSEQRINSDSQNFATQMAQLKENFNAEKKLLATVNEKYKTQYLDYEQQLSEVTSNYDKDKALWKGKFHFLEQQKEQAKLDLADAHNKFALTLAQLQAQKENNQKAIDQAQAALTSSMERRHQGLIQELNEAHAEKIKEMEDKYNKLEKTYNDSKAQTLVDAHGMIGGRTFMEKTLVEMQENVKTLRAELEIVKADRDSKTLECQKIFDKERETFKVKLGEVDQKFRDSESKRSTMVLEHEKQKAKWNLDKDNLQSKYTDAKETIDKLQLQKENLIKEIERVKSVRKSGSLGGGYTGFLQQRSLNVNAATKMKPVSPADSRGSTPSLDKNGSDTTHGSRQFEKNGLGSLGFKQESTVITSDDENS